MVSAKCGPQTRGPTQGRTKVNANPLAVCEYPCTEARYFADDALNATTIKECVASLHPLTVVPARGRVAKNEPSKATAAMVVGSATHSLALEGEKVYRARYAVMPEVDRRTKAGKAEVAAWLLDHQNAVGITAAQDSQARAMATAVHQNRDAHALLVNGRSEQAIFWTDRETLVECKAKLDHVTECGIVVDLKTCQDGTEAGFSRAVANYGYHIQAAFYRRAYREFCGGELPPFRFVVVESKPPHSVAVCELDETTIAAGEDIINLALRLWARGNDAPKDYGCYTVSLPPWNNHLLHEEATA